MELNHQILEIWIINMNSFVARLIILIMILVVGASCSTLTTGSAVKAGFESEEESWLSRKIPGVKALSNMIPPPTDARLKWDQYNKDKQKDPSKVDGF